MFHEVFSLENYNGPTIDILILVGWFRKTEGNAQHPNNKYASQDYIVTSPGSKVDVTKKQHIDKLDLFDDVC